MNSIEFKIVIKFILLDKNTINITKSSRKIYMLLV